MINADGAQCETNVPCFCVSSCGATLALEVDNARKRLPCTRLPKTPATHAQALVAGDITKAVSGKRTGCARGAQAQRVCPRRSDTGQKPSDTSTGRPNHRMPGGTSSAARLKAWTLSTHELAQEAALSEDWYSAICFA